MSEESLPANPAKDSNERPLIEGPVAAIRTADLGGSTDTTLLGYLQETAGINTELDQKRRTLTLCINLGEIDPKLVNKAITITAGDMLIGGHVFITKLPNIDDNEIQEIVGKSNVPQPENKNNTMENIQNMNRGISQWLDENGIDKGISSDIIKAVGQFELSVVTGFELAKSDERIAKGPLKETINSLNNLAAKRGI